MQLSDSRSSRRREQKRRRPGTDVIVLVRPVPGDLATRVPDLQPHALLDERTRAALTAAVRMASSPGRIDEATVDAVDKHLSSAETVEIAVWVSVLQLIHRLGVFFGLDGHHE